MTPLWDTEALILPGIFGPTLVPIALQHWVTGRQMRFEGGFQGRCNKLVDGCYSFWQAGLLPLLHRALHARGELPQASSVPRMASGGI